MNATLDGLEHAVKSVVSKQDKINISIYADDFIITGASQTVLEQKVKPAVENFLKVRGLELSAEKTRITTLQEGFDFLGFNVRKYGNKLLIKPARKSVQRFLENIRELIRKNCAASTAELIAQLNPRIRGGRTTTGTESLSQPIVMSMSKSSQQSGDGLNVGILKEYPMVEKEILS